MLAGHAADGTDLTKAGGAVEDHPDLAVEAIGRVADGAPRSYVAAARAVIANAAYP